MTEDGFNHEFLDRIDKISKFHRSRGATAGSQWKKVVQEFKEFRDAIMVEEQRDEACDLIIASIGYLHNIKVSNNEIAKAMAKTLTKCEKRMVDPNYGRGKCPS